MKTRWEEREGGVVLSHTGATNTAGKEEQAGALGLSPRGVHACSVPLFELMGPL